MLLISTWIGAWLHLIFERGLKFGNSCNFGWANGWLDSLKKWKITIMIEGAVSTHQCPYHGHLRVGWRHMLQLWRHIGGGGDSKAFRTQPSPVGQVQGLQRQSLQPTPICQSDEAPTIRRDSVPESINCLRGICAPFSVDYKCKSLLACSILA